MIKSIFCVPNVPYLFQKSFEGDGQKYANLFKSYILFFSCTLNFQVLEFFTEKIQL